MRPNISSVFPPAYAIAVSNSIKDDDDDGVGSTRRGGTGIFSG